MTRKIKLIKLDKIDSTNTYLKTLAENGEAEGCVVTAREQTQGRGRRGKSFFSPLDTGLYMSVLLRPSFSIDEALYITSMTAVALCRAIEALSDRKCGIKWVNDIYLDGKKVAGILSEGSFDHENNKVNYVVVGIGINLSTKPDSFPNELRDIATSLGETSKDELLEKILDNFFELYDTMTSHTFLEEYKARSIVLGKTIEILGSEPYIAKAIEIDDACRLIVESDNKGKITLSSGEISTKIIN